MHVKQPQGRFPDLYPQTTGTPPITAVRVFSFVLLWPSDLDYYLQTIIVTAYFFKLGDKTKVVQVPTVLSRINEGTTIPLIVDMT